MKNNKLELIFVLMVFLVLITTVMNNNTTENENNDIYFDQTSSIEFHPNFSKSWNNFTHIHLTGENWTTAKSYGWVTGSGSYLDPYILENMTINAGNYRSGIIIENSNVYFIIRNCTIRNTGSSTEDAGIKLINVNNSRISGNNFFDIDRIGIYLKMSCTNNTISDNYLFEDYPYTSTWMRYGIYLYDQCSNNSIKNNILHGINRFSVSIEGGGINLVDNCNLNKIENNLVNQCKYGIYLINYCDENTLFNNSIFNNDGNGIYISVYSDTNKIFNNTIYNNGNNGIKLKDHCYDGQILNNNISNNDYNGIHLEIYCDNHAILNNTLDFNNIGIFSDGTSGPCNYITITNNKLHNNSEYGIRTLFSRYTKISDNNLFGCGFLIESPNNIVYFRDLLLSTNNTVNGKKVYYYVNQNNLDTSNFSNPGQIILINCNNTEVRNIEFSYCSIGLYIYWGTDNTITNLTLSGNIYGMQLKKVYNTMISKITAKECIKVGIALEYSDNNKIFDSTMIYNDIGIDIYDDFNITISNCTIKFNSDTGIYLGASDNNTLIKNTICNNSYEGTSFSSAIFSNGGCYNKIFENYICNNSNNGIYLWYSADGNNISHNNTIYNNGLNGIYFEHDCVNNTVLNNTIIYNQNGIYLEDICIKNNIAENRILNNAENGIYFLDSHNNTIINNEIDKNNQNGIYLETSDNITITGNFINNNKNHGIYLDECINSVISLNNFTLCGLYITGSLTELKSHQIDISNEINKKKLCYYTDQSGLDSSLFTNAGQIILINCSDAFISKVNVTSGSLGIMLYFCDNITIKEINSSYNKLYGIYLDVCNNTAIIDNTINDNIIGIYLQGDYLESNSYFNNITGNQLSFNVQYGIYFSSYCLLNQIVGNNISYNGIYGIYLESGCNNNTIYLNKICFNNMTGIYLSNADYNIIVENTINDNANNGIYIYYMSEYTTIYNNNISNNKVHGIRLIDVWNGANIIQNRIIHNWQNGIFLQSSYNCYIISNLIEGNLVKGLRLEGGSNNNLIYNNSFINNPDNADDNGGSTNSWDNGSLGNYWDDYTGGDNNNDGIGDTPYYVPGTAGSRDNYPIWGKPSNEAGVPSNGEDDSSDGKDNEQSSDNLTTYILGGVIIGSIIGIYIGLQVYSKKHPLRKSVISKEPFLESYPEETDQLKTKTTTTRAPQSKSTTKRSESYLQKPIGIDDFDRHFIQEKLRIKSLKINDLYDEILRNNSIISNYLESDISIDNVPDGERLIATILSEEDLRKIELIDLPANDKKIFLMEILSLNTKERNTILDDMIQNVE